MYIKQIRLRDWKAYVDAELVFPNPTRKRNVVLVGAMNGYGKTSLLEAIVLGLFGRDGLGILARATIQDGENERLTLSYDDFLQRALHARAIEHGRTSMSIEIILDDEGDEGDVVKIQRIWHFTGSGAHRRDEEEVRIFTGEDEDTLHIPRTEDREDYIRNFVAKSFLPVHLARFFLFDGEQVQLLAKREMSAQVRVGIEGMLGVPVLRHLISDLTAYSSDRRRSLRTVGDESIERLRAEVAEAEKALQDSIRELDELKPQIPPKKARRDQLVKEMGSLQGGTYANLKELMELKGKDERERDKYRERIAHLVREDLALAIAGRELRHRAAAQLKAEDERDKWESGKSQSAGGLTTLLSAMDASTIQVEPPLTDDQRTRIRQRVIEAWEHVWHPPPDSCASAYQHDYLGSADRVLVLSRLSRVDSIGLGVLREVLEKLDELDRSIRRTESQIAQQQGVGPKVEALAKELQELNQVIAAWEQRERELSRGIDGSRATIAPKRQELARGLEGHERAQPALRRLNLADRIAAVLEEVIGESYPRHIEEVASEMTVAFKAMAHKTVVHKIEIDPDCTVRMLGDAGRDVRTMDTSAGENQIFALSLIAAISVVSKRNFPIVMDTPLARLDTDHRLRVLKYFTEKLGQQVILLSQPDEVHGRYLNAIRDKIGVACKVVHSELGDGVGTSSVTPGYFEKV